VKLCVDTGNDHNRKRGPFPGSPPFMIESKKRALTAEIRESRGINARSVSLTGLFILAAVWFLHQARDFAVPLTLAVLLHFLLTPVVRWFKRRRIVEPVAAALILSALTGLVVLTMYQLGEPAAHWLEKAPKAMRIIEERLLPVKESMTQITEASNAMDRVGQTDSPSGIRKVQVVSDQRAAIMNLMGKAMAGIGTTLLILYFLLASGDLFAQKLLNVLSRREDRGCAVDILRGMERQLSGFLFQTIIIQTAFGLALWLSLWALGMPNPGLWAALAAVLQIIPYLGGFAVLLLIAVVAAVTFDHTWAIAGPVLAYMVLTTLKGFLAPVVLGRQLVLNPVAVLVSLVFFGWMWGFVGTLLAVPLLACFKIMCDHIDWLKPAGEFVA
jgi:predicted PurR-regulated permease PerM